jgi:hypothetical protein
MFPAQFFSFSGTFFPHPSSGASEEKIDCAPIAPVNLRKVLFFIGVRPLRRRRPRRNGEILTRLESAKIVYPQARLPEPHFPGTFF